MKLAKWVGVFGLIFLTSCGSDNSDTKSSSQTTSVNPTKEDVDSSGCSSSRLPFGGGSGKEDDPYLLCTPRHLAAMTDSGGSNYFALTRDLDMDHEKHGYLGIAVMGVFDGRGHAIKNFTVNLEMDQEGGFLFGQLLSTNEMIAEIKNLKLDNVSIKTNSVHGTAALIGSNNGGRVTNVHVTGTISGREMVGGIVALNFGVIQESSFDGNIQGQKVVGGIAARTSNYSINKCHVGGHTSGGSSVGGIAGEAEEKAELTDNEVTANVTGQTDFGLFVGVKRTWHGSAL